jgi:hypothetical protein
MYARECIMGGGSHTRLAPADLSRCTMRFCRCTHRWISDAGTTIRPLFSAATLAPGSGGLKSSRSILRMAGRSLGTPVSLDLPKPVTMIRSSPGSYRCSKPADEGGKGGRDRARQHSHAA